MTDITPPIFRPRKGETYTQIVRIGRRWGLRRRRHWTAHAVPQGSAKIGEWHSKDDPDSGVVIHDS